MPPRRQRMTRAEVLLRFVASTLLVLGLLALLFASLLGAWHMWQRLSQATTDEEDAQRQFATLQMQAAQIEASVVNLQNDRGVEAALRERYGVARPGEGVIQIVQNQGTSSGAIATSSSNFFVRIFRNIFGW